MPLFESRTTASKQVAPKIPGDNTIDLILAPYDEARDIAENLSQELEVPFETWKSDFLTCPGNKRINIGAVAEDGTLWIQDSLRTELDVTSDYIQNSSDSKTELLRTRTDEELKQLVEDKNVLIASDGISEGFREAAVAGSLKKKGAKGIFIAAPVVSRTMMSDLRTIVDDLFFAREVPFLHSADQCYREKSGLS